MTCSSSLGTFAVVWLERRGTPVVRRILLPNEQLLWSIDSAFPGARPGRHITITKLAHAIRDFLHGADITFPLDRIALDLCSPFQRGVLRAEHRIPRGHVSTYGGIAAHLGSPNLARAVGRALATNPFPIIIPCHRAIASGGRLGGYQGGLAMKRILLAHEGVSFTDDGRIARPHYFYPVSDR